MDNFKLYETLIFSLVYCVVNSGLVLMEWSWWKCMWVEKIQKVSGAFHQVLYLKLEVICNNWKWKKSSLQWSLVLFSNPADNPPLADCRSHWPPGDWNDILDKWGFSNIFYWLMDLSLVKLPSAECHWSGPYWLYVYVSSGNGLVPSNNKSLPEPMLTQIYVAIWHL